jgi:beta-lactam-binding protein with PASTA domain
MKSNRPYGHTLRRRLLITLFVLLSIGALTCTYLTATYLPQKAPDSLEITLPSLVGQDLNDSQALLPDGYYDIVYEYRPDAKASPGTVLSQSPAAGSLRRTVPGRSPCPLRLVVSTGPKTYTLPALIGENAKQTAVQLRGQGLVVRIRRVIRNDLSPGQIVAMDPPKGTTLQQGQVVTLTESGVLTAKTVRVPDVVGTELALANNTLVLRGLRPDEPEYAYSDDIPPGCVISQRPLSGTMVVTGSSAHLVISQGCEWEE